MNFSEIAVALFRDRYCFELGSEQYADHDGVDALGRCMSGAVLWAETESSRFAHAARTGTANRLSAEVAMVRELGSRARGYVRDAGVSAPISVLEFGPGTTTAFREKTLQVVQAVSSADSHCMLIDNSESFLRELKRVYSAMMPNLVVLQGDIFSGQRFADWDDPTFMLMLGRTFGNLDAQASNDPPYSEASLTLRGLAKAARNGWLVVTVSSDLDRAAAKAYYELHPDFQLNTLFRMQAEIFIEGDFDPNAFAYEADVRGSDEYLQVIHTAIAGRAMSFQMEGHTFELRKGDRFHLKNSCCFSRQFMYDAGVHAGLDRIDVISDQYGTDLHVFRK